MPKVTQAIPTEKGSPRVAEVTIKPERTTTDRAQRREPTAGSGDVDTRDRVIQAAVACILDLGFYRGSSTNEIARRAGVTWGVIQWYFGNREGLMLAVLEEGAGHMVETVAEARIDGATVGERMTQLIDVFSAHYARPEYLASLQVLLNMDHDPRTSADVRKTMSKAAERSNAHIRRLLREALGPAANKSEIGDDHLSRHPWVLLQPTVARLHGVRHGGPEAGPQPAASAPVGPDPGAVHRRGRGSLGSKRFHGRRRTDSQSRGL